MTRSEDGYFSEGYHGTDITTAYRLVETGFDSEHGETCFATPDDLFLAEEHGQKNASRSGQEKFAVLRATFPETPLREGFRGGECIRLYRDEIRSIAIKSMTIYLAHNKQPLERITFTETE